MGVLDVPQNQLDLFLNRYIPRRREFPGWRGLPTVNASAFVATAGAVSGATSIAGSILVPFFDTSAFRYLGTIPGFFGNTFPNYNYYTSNGYNGNGYIGAQPTAYPSGKTSGTPWQIEFDFDTTDGQFEILVKGTSAPIRVIIDNQILAATGPTFMTASDGAQYLHLITGLSVGVHRVRIEMNSNASFGGIRTIASNALVAAPIKSLRCLVQGDSFSEPTISDTVSGSGGDGWPQRLAHLTGWDVWSAAKGSTGYVNPGVSGSVPITDPGRIGDIVKNNPDVIIVAAGINDIGYAGSTAASIGAAALLTFQAYRAALPNALIIVLSSFWQMSSTTYPATTLQANDAIKAAAAQVSGTLFLDLQRMALSPSGVTTDAAVSAPGVITNATGLAAGGTSFTSTTKYPTNTIVQIGNDSNAEIKKISGVSGSGPWTHTVSALQRLHAANSVVIPVGPSYVTGSGRVGATAGDGNADRYRGSDGTHPSIAGHDHIARTVFQLLCAALPS